MKNILALTILLLGSSYILGMDSESLVTQENSETGLYAVASNFSFKVTYNTRDNMVSLYNIKTGIFIKNIGKIGKINGERVKAITLEGRELRFFTSNSEGKSTMHSWILTKDIECDNNDLPNKEPKNNDLQNLQNEDCSLDKDTDELDCSIQ
ncbi:hypothetical protein H0X06_00615 [Candidatus Dependentiae bacterium]|nr:hypothetical protein [Candidatus Dependentiae bacterium]